MKISRIKKIIKKIKREFILLLVAAVAFSFAFYSIFLQSSLSEEEISEYSKSLEGDYSEYGNRINSASVSIKDLVNSEQVKRIEYHGRLIEERKYNEGRNPFIKER